MQVKIRAGFFETNSSSTHCVTIVPGYKHTKGHLVPSHMVVKGFGVVVEGGEFGWEEDSHNSLEMKMAYAVTGALSELAVYNHKGEIDSYGQKSIMHPDDETLFRPEVPTERQAMLFEVITRAHNATYDDPITPDDIWVRVSKNHSFHGVGYIDHQSSDEVDMIFESKENIFDFIFNPSSYFETGNDNSY